MISRVLRLATALLLTCGSVACATAAPAAPAHQDLPVRAAFYYPWFPEAWTQKSLHPYAHSKPALGLYDSGSQDTIAAHIRSMAYAHVDAAIVSWWGVAEKSEQDRIPTLLTTAATVDPAFRIALYYEKEGTANPGVDELVRDLTYLRDRYAAAGNYLRVGGRPVIFVYSADDQGCAVVERWAKATAVVDFYVVLKVFPRWERCPHPPDAWHQYAPAEPYSAVVPIDPRAAGSVTISPGFWRAEDGRPTLARDPDRWRRDVAAMAGSGAPWQLVTSFDEWGEGTSVENAEDWPSPSGYGTYLDALHDSG